MIKITAKKTGGFAFLINKRVIFHPEGISVAKGCDVSIKAMKIVIEKFSDTVLVLAGARDIVDRAIAREGDIVHIMRLANDLGIGDSVFVDIFAPDEIKKLHAIAEACVYPSGAENHEALAVKIIALLECTDPKKKAMDKEISFKQEA